MNTLNVSYIIITLECCFANRDSISMSVVCAVLNGELLPDKGGFEYISLASSSMVRHTSLTCSSVTLFVPKLFFTFSMAKPK